MLDKRQERICAGKQDAPHNSEALGLYQISIQRLLIPTTPKVVVGLNKVVKDV